MKDAFSDEIRAVRDRHPDWSFEKAFSHVSIVRGDLVTDNSAEENRVLAKLAPHMERSKREDYLKVEGRALKLIAASGGRITMSEALVRARRDEPPDPGKVKDPRVAEELAKHKKLDDARQADAIDTNVDRLKKIRKLMVDKNWTFDQAFSEICRQEGEAKKTEVTSETQTAHAHVEPAAEPKIFLVRAIECGRELEYGLES
jgi:hypothetical protein